MTYTYIGHPVARVDGADKTSGSARYTDDIDVPGVLHGALVRSPAAHGRLRKLAPNTDLDWSGVTVVTPDDIPGDNVVDMMVEDMPFLAHDLIRYRGEPLALVASADPVQARQAATGFAIEIDELPALYTIQDLVKRYLSRDPSLEVLARQDIKKGDINQGFAQADHTFERVYWTGHQEQGYLEPQGMIAEPQADDSILIRGSMQCPYYIQPELCRTLALPPEKIRVRQAVVGGAFGGKEDFPTQLAGYCALLALKAGRPVKIVFDRHEDMLYTTKRHPAWVRYRTGWRTNGVLTALDVEVLLDAGAYTTLSPVVLYRAILTATLGYRCEHVRVRGLACRSHTFPCGAFRGFGAPQVVWGLESHLDECAAALGLPPVTLRERNILNQGDATATGHIITSDMEPVAVFRDALARSAYIEKLARCSHGKGTDPWYGIGLAFFGHGSGFTGDGEQRLQAETALELEHDDTGRPVITILVSSTEMGQGTLTILSQITADGLGVDLARIRFPLPDTGRVPNSGPTVASRTAMVVGATIHDTAQALKQQLEQFAATRFFNSVSTSLTKGCFQASDADAEVARSFDEVADAYLHEHGALRVTRRFRLPKGHTWDQKTFRGDAYPSYAWGCNVVEVTVDPTTLAFRIERVTACFDIGRVINPMLAQGQIEGGLTQALGYAIMERIRIRDGLYDANRMQTYTMPTSMDIPLIDVHFLEYPYPHAAPGAKGVGEMPMNGLAPAIANALEQAADVRLRHLPMLPESMLEAWTRDAPDQ